MNQIRKIAITIFLLLLACWATAQPYCYVRTFSIRDGLAANTISGIDQSPSGLMWFATWNGLCCYDGYQFTTFRSDDCADADALSSNRIAMIKADSRENVWVRTYDSGLYLLDTRQCRFVNVGLLLEKKYGKTIYPRHFYQQPDGHTIITDERGELNVCVDDRYPTDVDHMVVVKEKDIKAAEPQAQKSEQPDTALAWRLAVSGLTTTDNAKHFIDRQGNLWLTSSHGLTLAHFPDSHMRWLPLVEGQETRSVLSRRDGSVWAGTKDGYIGIFTANGQQQGWLSPQGQVTTTLSRFADRIYTMKEDSKGRVWIGTKGQGLYVVSPQGAVRHYMPDAANSYSLSNSAVYDTDEDNQGNIWIGTYGGGLNLATTLPDGTLRFLHSDNDLKGYPIDKFNRIRRITHTTQGVLLLSCTEGVVTFSNHDRRYFSSRHYRQDNTSLRTSDVMQTLVTRNGQVYVATLGGGIQQLKSNNLLQDSLHFQLIPVLNRGLGNVMSMTEDGQGYIWVVYETEVCRYKPSTGEVERFNPNYLTKHIELTEGLSALDRQGNLWIAAASGLFLLNTQQMQKSRFSPHIIFTSLFFQGEQEPHPILNRQTLTIDKDQRNLTIQFAALDYGDHALIEYAYRMDNEKEWNYIGATPRISFSQLSPGIHTLKVKSTNDDGVWSNQVATLYLDVTPTLWERTWVRLLCLLLVIGLSTWAVIVWLRHRQHMQEREQRLENILQQYRELQQTVGTVEIITPPHHYRLETPHVVDEDQEMMQQLMKFIEEHVDDDGLRIDDMAQAVGLGRSVFYERLKSLVGVSPIDFLRQLRMQRAKELIKRSSMNVSQVAYAVGFTDPKYFTKCFKKETGMTPSEYRERGV